MAVIQNAPTSQPRFGGTPYGNQVAHRFILQTNALGAVVGGSSVAAVASGDVIRLGRLNSGMELIDSLTIVSTTFTAAVTGKLGFAYADGVDDATVPQDDDYFNAAAALNALGRYPANNTAVRPVTLPKDAWLTLTTGGGANAKAATLDVIVYGIEKGAL